MANEFKVRKGLIVQGSGSTILDIFGSQGELFSVTDSLSGSLFSVNDISGIPIMEVFSDNTIKMGTYNQEAIIVSGSRTGMGTALPQAKLHISGANSDSLLRVSSPTDSSILVISGSGNVGIGETSPTAKLEIKGSGATSATTALRVENSAATARLTILDDGTSAFNTSHLYISSSGNVGVGLTNPSARLHVSGASNSVLFEIDSPAVNNIIYVSGSGRVGINTSSSLATGLSIFQQSSSFMSPETAPTGSGLYVFSSGSGNTQPSIHVQNIGDAFASINLSTISGSTNPLRMWSLSKRNNANANALNLYYYNGTTYSSPLFSFIQNGVSTLGESTQIQLDDLNGFVGLNITPVEKVHINADPGEGNYLRIDAPQLSNSPPLSLITPDTGYGITTNKYYLAEPDYWMEIKLVTNTVLIPCYLPAP
jgi:hypothetical protein